MRADNRVQICITGADGSGKSTLASLVIRELEVRGYQTVLLWSRFNNITSKPLLALARLFGKSPKEKVGEHTLGYHHFSNTWWLRWPFIFLQTIDVNIALWLKYRKIRKDASIIVFERSPWDTLADLSLDTNIAIFRQKWWTRKIIWQVRNSKVYYIFRSYDNTLITRRELVYDKNLAKRIDLYSQMYRQFKWTVIDNNRELSETLDDLLNSIVESLGGNGNK